MTARIGVIFSSALLVDDLRARTYFGDPALEAKELVSAWAREHGLSPHGPAMTKLAKRIETALREAEKKP